MLSQSDDVFLYKYYTYILELVLTLILSVRELYMILLDF